MLTTTTVTTCIGVQLLIITLWLYVYTYCTVWLMECLWHLPLTAALPLLGLISTDGCVGMTAGCLYVPIHHQCTHLWFQQVKHRQELSNKCCYISPQETCRPILPNLALAMFYHLMHYQLMHAIPSSLSCMPCPIMVLYVHIYIYTYIYI